MPLNSNVSRVNPQIKTVSVGVRELRDVKIYPLSMNDQYELSNLIMGILKDAASGKLDPQKQDQEEVLSFIQTLIFDNLMKILEFVTDPEEKPSIDELTNDQFYEIADVIFVVNFEGFLKNFKALVKRAKGIVVNEEIKIPGMVENQ